MERYQARTTYVEAISTDPRDYGHGRFFLHELNMIAPGKWRYADGASTVEILAGKDGAQGWVPVPHGHWIVRQPGDPSDIWPVEGDYFRAKYDLPAVP